MDVIHMICMMLLKAKGLKQWISDHFFPMLHKGDWRGRIWFITPYSPNCHNSFLCWSLYILLHYVPICCTSVHFICSVSVFRLYQTALLQSIYVMLVGFWLFVTVLYLWLCFFCVDVYIQCCGFEIVLSYILYYT